ncbi:MAG: hypothetical protein M1816_001562 [Peltula sp. TS41687]|nr:MAG: hypothetical protein M1816_001562 [Peltula sp. TS41687]
MLSLPRRRLLTRRPHLPPPFFHHPSSLHRPHRPLLRTTSTSSSSSTPRPPRRRAKAPLIISGVAVYLLATYGFYLYRSYVSTTTTTTSTALRDDADVSARYDDTAATFDRDVELTEMLMGIRRLRKKLVAKVRDGDEVLETAAGTGRNLKYYTLTTDGDGKGGDMRDRGEKGVRRLVCVDKSRAMLERARNRFRLLRVSGVFPRNVHRKVEFLVQDAMDPIPPPPPPPPSSSTTSSSSSSSSSTTSSSSSTTTTTTSSDRRKFDTVIQTMGLCSTADPVGLLRHMGEMTDPEHGQILLLEHGRSHYGWLNEILDSLAQAHAVKHGCWWNRDIGRIVEESGLEVVRIKRFHFGTTWWVELRPRSRSR